MPHLEADLDAQESLLVSLWIWTFMRYVEEQGDCIDRERLP